MASERPKTARQSTRATSKTREERIVVVMAERASEDESEAHEQRSSDDVDGWSFALSLLRDIAIVR